VAIAAAEADEEVVVKIELEATGDKTLRMTLVSDGG
jgi:hypothetical protein